MFVGYAKDHAGNCYRMYNPATSRIHTSRDVKWLGRMYYNSVRFQNSESSTFESGKGVKDEADAVIEIDEEDNHPKTENSNIFFDDASSSSESSSDTDSSDESSSDDEGSSSDSSDDDDPYKI